MVWTGCSASVKSNCYNLHPPDSSTLTSTQTPGTRVDYDIAFAVQWSLDTSSNPFVGVVVGAEASACLQIGKSRASITTELTGNEGAACHGGDLLPEEPDTDVRLTTSNTYTSHKYT